MKRLIPSLLPLAGIFTIFGTLLQATGQTFVARHVHPLTITGDGNRLLAVNSSGSRLSIFATGEAPLLVQEIPVGLVPVSVRLRTPDEAWIVNELSDSISVVSLSRGSVIATLHTGDEPGDVAFIENQAFVTCSRENKLEVFNTSSHEKIDEIPLEGLFPRSLAVSPDGRKLYVSFLHTSNGTTILPREKAPPQDVPVWVNPALPSPPQTARIVSSYHPQIDYEVIDHDIAVIAADDFDDIEYRGNLGTNIFNLCISAEGEVFAPNSEARNLIFFEPQLRSRYARSRIAILGEGGSAQVDLNPDPDLTFPLINHSDSALALAQAKIALPDANGQHVWIAAFGSDRIAKLRLSDQVIVERFDLRSADQNGPRNGGTVRGPRGLALHPTLSHLYCLNKLSHTLTTIDRETGTILAEAPLSSTPDLNDSLKIGRGILSDARLSGNGTVSCATCHIDLERDGIAWDLGDPTGDMLTVQGAFLSLHLPNTFADRVMHPMKGPMVTQTLIGLSEQTKLHWRGDKPTIQSFNATFPKLMGGTELPESQMDLVADYLDQLRHHPNPHLKLDRNLPAEVAGGNPSDGIAVFTLFDNHCSSCHSLPSGTSNNIDVPSTVGSFQPLKDAPLRTTYQRTHFNPEAGSRSRSGFGMGSDGSLHELPIGHPYSLHILEDIDRPLAVREKEKKDLTAFILSFDTGTAPAIGHCLTFSSAKPPGAEELNQLAILESQAKLKELSGVALVANGIVNGRKRSFRYSPDLPGYLSGREDEPAVSAQTILSSLGPGDVISFMGVPFHQSFLLSTDWNANGIPDSSEKPPVAKINQHLGIIWPSDASDWYPEYSTDFNQWFPLTSPRETNQGHHFQPAPSDFSKAFFRLRRTHKTTHPQNQ